MHQIGDLPADSSEEGRAGSRYAHAHALAWSANGLLLAVGGKRSVVQVYGLLRNVSAEPLYTYCGHTDDIHALALCAR